MTEHEKHSITGTYKRQTERGLMFEVQGEDVWVPKSQVRKLAPSTPIQEGEEITLEVPDWLARDKGLVE